ncbi:choice-of-anchor D domain-containing protein [Brevifollis gellanilyticus]|uniref:HYDIN/VesB/CFA65-like Ig-like domain-containing protein n=1 Tax=Brevifollis gellanilyticus TaxID=748831 RepID=A0A512MF63_9BACT|nr:choice-of-anchor D domain-containing protein [Brevifollis gellanilyticus]GEP45379.1 hypothetical protein BGE01nite_46700 [Brevifollis gellanilyticus]
MTTFKRGFFSAGKTLLVIAALALALASQARADSILTNILGSNTTSQCVVNDVDVDSSGNCYYTGSFNGTVDFGGGDVTDPNPDGTGGSIFIAKYNGSGVLQWVRAIGGTKISTTYGDVGRQIAVDASGNVYAAGLFKGNVTTGTLDFDPGAGAVERAGTQGNDSAFTVKLDGSGLFQWVWTFKAFTGATAHVAVNSSSVYIFGAYTGAAAPNSTPMTDGAGTDFFPTDSGNANHYYAVKLASSTGARTWTSIAPNSASGYSSGTAQGVTVDSSGNMYCVGNLGGNTFGSTQLLSGTPPSTYAMGFIWKLDASGATTWARKIQSTSSTTCRGVVTDTDGNVYVAGSYQGTADFDPGSGTTTVISPGANNDLCVIKLTSAGDHVWNYVNGGSGVDSADRLCLDQTAGALYVQGSHQGGFLSLTTQGFADILTMRLATSDGSLGWAKSFGSTRTELVGGIAINSGGVKIAATIRNTSDVDPSAGVLNAATSLDNVPGLASVSWTASGDLASAVATAPEIAVTESAANVADNGSLSFGTTTVGTVVTKTFTVNNTGTATLNLSNLSVPSGFSIAQNFGSSTVAANGSTTFQITMTAAAAATPSGTLSFDTNDSDENPYNFTVSGTVAAPPNVAQLGTPAFVTVADSIASYTVNAGTNRLLLVTVSHAETAETAAASAVTFAGQAMTQVGVKKDGLSVDSIWARVLGSGSSVTGAIVATRYPSMGTKPLSFLSAQAFENVDQTTPTSGATTNANATAGNSSVNVPSAVGDMVMDLYDVWALSGVPNPSVNGGQTPLNNSGPLPINANNLGGYGGTAHYQTSTKPGAAGTVSIGWTATANAAIQVGLNIKRAAGGGGAPEITVTESAANVADNGSLSFGTTTVGTVVTKTFTVNNTGTATLNLSSLSVPSGFSIAQNFGSSTVAANGSTTFQITMTAAAAATPSGTLSFDTNDSDENPYNFTVSGTISLPPPDLTVGITHSPAGFIRGQTGTLTFVVNNIGTGASSGTFSINSAMPGGLVVNSIVSGSGWNFTASTSTTVQGTYTGSIAAGGTSPTATVTVDVASNAPASLNVSGTVTGGGETNTANNTGSDTIPVLAPEIAVTGNGNNIADGALLAAASSTNATDFGSTPVQGGAVEMTYTISNSGGAPLNLSGTPKVSVNSSDFTVTQQPAATVAAGGNTTFKVSFDPSTAGVISATVSVANNDGDENPFDFVVKGTGTGPQTFDLAGNAVSNTPFDGGQSYIYTTVPPYMGSTGVLDTTFDGDGKRVHPFGNAGDGAYAVAIQSDGKIVATGYTLNTSTSVNNVPIVRYNSNGSFDTSFDGDGKVASVFGTADAWANGVAIQSDGKIVVAGMATAGASGKVFLVARYTSGGALDTSFGAIGYAMTDVSASVHEDVAYALVIQSDGKILVAGTCDTSSQGRQFAIVRYTSGGILDTGFGSGGKVFTDFTTGDDIARAITIQPDGKIIVAGEAGASSDFAAARYLADGTLDTTFNTTGKFTHSITAGTDGARGVGVQSSGAIVLGGFAGTGNSRDMALVRLTSTGLLDTTFNSTGVVTTPIGSGVDEGRSLIVQPDDKLILAGASHNGTNHDVAVVRYTSEGVLDTSFNTTGKVVTPVGVGNDVASAAALQSTGEIVVAGETTVGNNQDFLLVRYGLGNVPTTSAEIVVEQPAGSGLLDGTASVAFGSQEVATTATKTFTIKNTGTGVLNVIGVSFTGADADDFSATAPGSTVAATNGSTTFDVTFSPLGAGDREAVMHIASDDADEGSFDIQVTGKGLAVISGTWTGGTPLVSTSGPFDATGITFETDLGYVPTPEEVVTFVHADGGITGHFNDLPDGGVVAMAINGVIYYFQVDYTGTDITLKNFTPTGAAAWKWVGGPKARNGIGVYGTLGTADSGNNPGARQGAMNWRAPDGSLWMFGGYGHASVSSPTPRYLNDVWQYRRDIGQWVWRAGANIANQLGVYGTQGTEAAANTPGSRHSGTTWTDGDGNLWMFGGYGVGSASGVGPLNDLWRFNRTNAQWTHMKGSNLINGTATYGTQGAAAAGNTPGSRSNAAGFYRNGSLWLFGGYNGANYYNDLWRYDIATGNWTWVGGSSTPNQNGVYGTQGTAAAGNMPGSRRDATAWTALDGTLWLFGGLGLPESGAVAADMSDLWSYDPVSGNWTWRKGVKTTGATGVYGTINMPASTNLPGARSAGSGWVTVDGDLWLVAGFKDSGLGFDDVWIYDVATNQWTWKLGSEGLLSQTGVYGTQGEPDAANKPGGRFTPSTWVTLNGTLWIFGGGGADGLGGTGRLSDLWSYGIPMPNGAINDSGSLAAFPDSLILNAAPTAGDATAGTMAYVPVSGQLTGEDADGDPIKFNSAGATAGSKGTLTLNADGTWTYTPAYGFTGLASFQFKANDNYGGVSSVKTLIISVIPNPADSDGDGIADAFEQQMWGSLATADGEGDADLDGQSNYFEFLAGTNPLDGGERLGTTPTIGGVGTANGGVLLQLNHVRPGVNYHLETSADLEAWSRIGTFTFDAAGSATLEDPTPATGAPRFYRMSLEATPAVIVP